MSKKKICILTTAHPIDDVRVYHKIALSLSKEFEVIWIGPDIYYFENELEIDGIKRLLFHNRKGSIGRLTNNYKTLKLFLKQKNVDFVYIPDPELAFFFSLIKKSRKSKSIFDIHEVFHKDLLSRKIKGFLFPITSKLLQKVMKNVVHKFDLTIGVNSNVLNYYVSNKKSYYIIRSCLPQGIVGFDSDKLSQKKIFTIVHGKNHMARGTQKVLEALSILKEKNIKCKVLMIDQDSSNSVFKNYVDEIKVHNYIDLHNGMPFVQMQKLMSQCHAGIIAYGRDLGEDSLPNRFFEYMALGIPVVVPSFSKEMVDIINEEHSGISVDTEDPKQIAESFEYLIKNEKIAKEMGENGRAAFLKNHNWEAEIKPLMEYLKLN